MILYTFKSVLDYIKHHNNSITPEQLNSLFSDVSHILNTDQVKLEKIASTDNNDLQPVYSPDEGAKMNIVQMIATRSKDYQRFINSNHTKGIPRDAKNYNIMTKKGNLHLSSYDDVIKRLKNSKTLYIISHIARYEQSISESIAHSASVTIIGNVSLDVATAKNLVNFIKKYLWKRKTLSNILAIRRRGKKIYTNDIHPEILGHILQSQILHNLCYNQSSSFTNPYSILQPLYKFLNSPSDFLEHLNANEASPTKKHTTRKIISFLKEIHWFYFQDCATVSANNREMITEHYLRYLRFRIYEMNIHDILKRTLLKSASVLWNKYHDFNIIIINLIAVSKNPIAILQKMLNQHGFKS